jgi:putative membrane protein
MSDKFQEYQIERRLHPLTIFYRAIIGLQVLAVPLYLAFINKDSQEWFFIVLSIVFALVAFPFNFLSYYYFTFLIKKDEIIIKHGVLSRNQRNIPIERVQNVDITQNFLQQMLNIAKVEIQTAGGTETEGLLEYVSKKDAEEIRDVIRQYQNIIEQEKEDEKAVTVENDLQTEDELIDQETNSEQNTTPNYSYLNRKENGEKELFKMSIRELVTYGMLRFRPLVLVGIFILLQYLNVFPSLMEDVESYLDVESLKELDVTMIVIYAILFLLLTMFLSWIADILLTVNQFYDFRLSLEGNKLHTEYGLLGKRKGTIPLKKLQSVTMTSNFITRKLNLYSLRLQTAGLGVRKSMPEIAVPLASYNRVQELAHGIRNFQDPVDFKHVSPLTIRRAMFRYSMALLPILALGLYLTTWMALLLILTPLLYYAAVLRYQYRGYAIQDENILIKQGFFFQRISIIPIQKIQTLHIVETYFQRRLGLATINVDTAGMETFSDASIIDVAAEDAIGILDELTNAYNQKMQKGILAIGDKPS